MSAEDTIQLVSPNLDEKRFGHLNQKDPSFINTYKGNRANRTISLTHAHPPTHTGGHQTKLLIAITSRNNYLSYTIKWPKS